MRLLKLVEEGGSGEKQKELLQALLSGCGPERSRKLAAIAAPAAAFVSAARKEAIEAARLAQEKAAAAARVDARRNTGRVNRDLPTANTAAAAAATGDDGDDDDDDASSPSTALASAVEAAEGGVSATAEGAEAPNGETFAVEVCAECGYTALLAALLRGCDDPGEAGSGLQRSQLLASHAAAALVIASKYGKQAVVTTLVEAKADVAAHDEASGHTALMVRNAPRMPARASRATRYDTP